MLPSRTASKSLSFKKMSISFGIAVALLYIVFHALNGNHGVYALVKEQQREAVASKLLERITAEREALEQQVATINTKTLDLDMLEEQARKKLGYAEKDEWVVIIEDPAL